MRRKGSGVATRGETDCSRRGTLTGLLAVGLAACLAMGGVAHATGTSASAAIRSDVPTADPSVLQGQLPNGLRYAVQSNHKPGSSVSFRFYIEAGSVQEMESERGVAHFLEHMAFEGGRAIPGAALASRFQEAGISIERDHNAFTNLTGTYYVMDLQAVTPAKLDLALSWLRDVADGLTLDPDAVDRQRGVVTSEYYARRDGGTNVSESIRRFLQPELLAPRRSPGGTPETLKALTADTLRGYYTRYYRPDRAFVIVVGDLPAAELKARVEATFSSWTATGPAEPDPDAGRVDYARKTSFYVVHTPNFAQGVVDICRPAPSEPHLSPSVVAWKSVLADVGWMLPLQERLDHLARAPDAPFVSAKVERSEQQKRFAMTCVFATPKPDRWSDALATLSDEMRRLERHGVTSDEYQRTLTVIAARVGAAATASRTSSQIAQALIQTLLDRDVPVTAETSARLFETARSQTTEADVAASLHRKWTMAAEPQLVLISINPAAPGDLSKAWQSAQLRPPPPQIEKTAAPPWAYAQIGPPGKVVDRQEITDPNFVRLTFSNGVHANIKTLRSDRNRVEIRVRFGAGELEFAPTDLGVATIGAGVVTSGGLGKHDDETLSRLLEAHATDFRFSMERDHFNFSGVSRSEDAALLTQVLAAYLLDPGFRPESDRDVPQTVKTFYTNLRVSPMLVAQRALRSQLPGNPGSNLPPEALAAGFKATDFARVFRPALLGDPVEVTVVGDISEDEATRLLAASFGALPKRSGPKDTTSPEAIRLRFPARSPQAATARHIGLPSKAGVLVVWPMFVWTPERQREVRAVTLLREVLSDRVRRIVREKFGQTYTPDVSYVTDRGGDEGALTVAIETRPDAVREVVDEVRSIARALSHGDITADELERIRKPLLDDTAHRRETAGWWLNTLDGSFADSYRLAQARTWQADYSSIPVAEVNTVARRWLARDPMIAAALPEGPAAPVNPSGS